MTLRKSCAAVTAGTRAASKGPHQAIRRTRMTAQSPNSSVASYYTRLYKPGNHPSSVLVSPQTQSRTEAACASLQHSSLVVLHHHQVRIIAVAIVNSVYCHFFNQFNRPIFVSFQE